MSLYKRGKIWWYKFEFAGTMIRESSKHTNQQLAQEAEWERRTKLRDAFHGIKRQNKHVQLFSTAADAWLEAKVLRRPRSARVITANVGHLRRYFGNMLLFDIDDHDVVQYQAARLRAGYSPKTCNEEVKCLKAIRRKNGLPLDAEMLDEPRNGPGLALDIEQGEVLLDACRQSLAPALYPVVLTALCTAMRHDEIRLLTWKQVDFEQNHIRVGDSKTDAGAGRIIPMQARLRFELDCWRQIRRPDGFVFSGSAQPARKFLREAWATAKKRAGLTLRFHDLRHTAITWMLESGISFPILAELAGWSPATAVRMAGVYGHIKNKARREAIDKMEAASTQGAQKRAQSPEQVM
jgi:integrase